MRWYLIMIPFLTLFTYTTFKLEVYNSRINELDLVVLNSLYEATNINKLRNYDENAVENLEVYLTKNVALESQTPLPMDFEIYTGDSDNLSVLIKWKTILDDTNIQINKNYIMDSTI